MCWLPLLYLSSSLISRAGFHLPPSVSLLQVVSIPPSLPGADVLFLPTSLSHRDFPSSRDPTLANRHAEAFTRFTPFPPFL
ncbi:hypothetical protein B0H66DRAFT_545617 [Apodospora peruviana]|uniref:Secreted protein n=1 Tax=Apodospora peruviana TaxID=516989 RepID=A0AAE0ITW8_9PEZI|nr:hypothetical protein B0H66DRAFT_545617 [Apodospora peruviana]